MEWLDRLEETLPKNPPGWSQFRAMIEARVAVGEERYGDTWRGKDLITEGMEEMADGVAYLAFEAALDGEDIDLALTAAYHAWRAAAALMHLRAKRAGEPGVLESRDRTGEPLPW